MASLQGDAEAFSRLFERHKNKISLQMWRFCRNEDICRELVHEVFVEVYFSLTSYKGRAPFVHWLRTIAVRVGYRYLKLEKKHALHHGDVLTESNEPRGLPDATDAAELVHDILKKLKPADRLVLILMYYEGYTIKEIAAQTGWSRSVVKMRAHRARRRFKDFLDDDLEGD